MPLAIVLGFALLLVGLIAGTPRWRARRRAAWAARPFPPEWRAVLRRHVPLYRRLPAPLQAQLRRHVQVILAETPVVGCGGLAVTDEIRVTIAAHAALLRLNRGGAPFPELRRILVYPGAFLVDRVQAAPGGVLREERHALAGESWSQGQVILSWQDVLAGAHAPDGGHNVVLHEFAHQLDQAAGAANGAPRLASRAAQARWAQVMAAEFEALHGRLREREARRAREAAWRSWHADAGSPMAGRDAAPPADAAPELISDYGATHPAEFFAVVTEVFFGRAAALAERHPALFALLRDFYAVDPREWAAPLR